MPSASAQRWLMITANLYAFGLSFQSSALLTITVPALLVMMDPAHHTEVLAQLSTAGAFVAMVLPPLVGAGVDASRASARSRRIAAAAGAALNLLGLAGMFWAKTLITFFLFCLVTMAGHSVTTVAYQAIWTDAVGPHRRGTASGYNGAATLLGTIAGLLTAAFMPTRLALWPMFAAILLGYLSTHAMPVKPALPVSDHADRRRVTIRDRRDFLLVFSAQALASFGMTLLMTYVLYFFRDVLHLSSPQQATAWVAVCSLAGAVISSIALGRLSDHGRRRNLVALAILPMALAACGFAVHPDPRWILAYAVGFGLGYGGFASTGWALTLDTLPDPHRITRDLGVWGVASVLPTVIAPAIGGWLLGAAPSPDTGYRILFTLAGLCFAACIPVVLAVRARPSTGEARDEWARVGVYRHDCE